MSPCATRSLMPTVFLCACVFFVAPPSPLTTTRAHGDPVQAFRACAKISVVQVFRAREKTGRSAGLQGLHSRDFFTGSSGLPCERTCPPPPRLWRVRRSFTRRRKG